jgi:hypothetical protein
MYMLANVLWAMMVGALSLNSLASPTRRLYKIMNSHWTGSAAFGGAHGNLPAYLPTYRP